jgi:nanoRNase/pAp phosphatase (c-di-AMP/oligoRNAs hydrolase)
MSAFVESCVETVASSASRAERRNRGRPRARALIRALTGKRRILVTTHMHPDPDALGSCVAMVRLLQTQLPQAEIAMSIKGQLGGGVNAEFIRLTELHLTPWDDAAVASYDGIVLLDTQPSFAYCPLPAGVLPTALVDHHRARGRRPTLPFVDVRTDAGAAASIVFSYFMELDVPIDPGLAASLLYAIESDLAGASGAAGGLDNLAVSSLTLVADQRRLHRMRFSPLPRSYFRAIADALDDATLYGSAVVTHLGSIETLEKPAIIADLLLRYDRANCALVTAEHDGRLVISLRTDEPKLLAGSLLKSLLRGIGEGGGHKQKAGGFARPAANGPAAMKKLRQTLLHRLARRLRLDLRHGERLLASASD